MDHLRILRDIRSGEIAPIYALMGEEPYFIDQISQVLEDELLTEAEKAFNLTVVYGRDVSMDQVISSAKAFPMMGERQVLVVREAQAMADWKKSENLAALEHYAGNPQPSTVLVFAYKGKKMDGRSKAVKKLKTTGVWFESPRLKEARIPGWVKQYTEDHGYAITDKASYLLAEFLGTDLSKLSNELDKLMILVPKGAEITPDEIEKNIGISKDYNIFELQRALSVKDVTKANRIVNYFLANPKTHPLQMVIPVLYSYFSKLLVYSTLKDKSSANVAKVLRIPPFVVGDYAKAGQLYPYGKLRRIIGYLREMDRKVKGIDVDKMETDALMREMIFKTLH